MRLVKCVLFYVVLATSFVSGIYVSTSLTTQAQTQKKVIVSKTISNTPDQNNQLSFEFVRENSTSENSSLVDEILANRVTRAQVKKITTPQLSVNSASPSFLNQIIYPSVGLNVTFLNSELSDFYDTTNGTIDYSKPKSTSNPTSNIQQLMNQGPVHVAFTPTPGKVGNAYFVAHNFLHFSPIQEKGTVGDSITLYSNGVKQEFKIFETRYINKYDTKTAYYSYPGKKMITLQTCTSNPDNMWIIRAELQ
jgi:hypothetical protein